MPGRSSGMKPRRASEIDDLVVAIDIGTEIPYPSSHTERASGTCSTPAALTDSQNSPSLVDASPIVPNATSLPPIEKPSCADFSCGLSRYSFEAYARPMSRGIQPATLETSALELAISTERRNSPASSRNRVAK